MDTPTRRSLAPYVMLALALAGLADALYVAHASYTGQPLWCAILEGCNTVIKSPYARIFDVPVSYFGVTFYVYMLGLAALLAFDPCSRGLRAGAVAYTALGVAYSAYFAYLQASAIRAVCIYCLVSAVTTVALFVAAVRHFRVTRAMPSADDRDVIVAGPAGLRLVATAPRTPSLRSEPRSESSGSRTAP